MRRAAARSQCANNLKQLALACHNYESATLKSAADGTQTGGLPPGTLPCPGLPPEQRLSWMVGLLPYLEQEPLAKRFDLASGWDAPRNRELTQTSLRFLVCPDWKREKDEPDHFTSYIGVAGLGADAPLFPVTNRRAGVFGYDRQTTVAGIADGSSYTLLILESARDNGPWAAGGLPTVRGLDPDDQPYLGGGRPFGGTHFSENTLWSHGKPLGCLAAMADASVRSFDNDISPAVLEALATAAGGEKLPDGGW